jgi:hypothetical protein
MDSETQRIKRILRRMAITKQRIVIDYDFIEETGRYGYVYEDDDGKHYLYYNSRTVRLERIMVEYVQRIRTTDGKEVIYERSGYVPPVVEVRPISQSDRDSWINGLPDEYTHCVVINGETWGNCRSEREAINLAKKMS